MKPYEKKLIAFITSIFMVVSFLSGAAYAQDDNTTYSSDQSTEGVDLSENDSAFREGQNVEKSTSQDSHISDAKGLHTNENTDSSDETLETSEDSTDENQKAVSSTDEMTYSVAYSMHVQTYGWLEEVTDGTTVGESGSGKRAEAIIIRILTNGNEAAGTTDVTEEDNMEGREAASEDTLGIKYRAHVQGIGWQDWVSDGSMAGTTGQAKRMEALEIELTGAPASDYNVYYRVYVNTYGWMSWAQNGEAAGSISYGKAIESLEIRLCKKDAENSPETEGRPCLTKAMLGSINYSAHVQTIGWQGAVQAGETAGTTGKAKRMEALTINRNSEQSEEDNLLSGGISYRAHVQSIGWKDWVNDGDIAGTIGQAKRLEAIQIQLTGDLATYADVYYRTHIQGYGWLGWAKNGQVAGSTGIKYRMEAIQIKVVPKDMEVPGSNSGYYRDATILENRVANMKVAKIANQLVLVSASGSQAIVSMYQKNSNGIWKNLLSTSGYVGKSGVGKAYEGISVTPEGAYHIMKAFGIKSDPGCSIGYTKVDSTHYYVGDPTSPYYNKLVSTRSVTDFRRSYGEQLIKYPPAYNYILDFDYNPNGTPYAGSCFFLHCSTGKATAGCISVPEAAMVQILKKIQKNCMIVIANGDKVYKY